MMGNEIISRAEAKARGLKRYFTGKPCKHGHVDFRNTQSRLCYECKRMYSKKDWEKNYDKKRDKSKAYFSANKARVRETSRIRNSKDPQKKRDALKKWRANNLRKSRISVKEHREKNKEYYREYKKAWDKKNRLKRIVCEQNREAKKRLGGRITEKQILFLLKQQSNRCAYCRVDISGNYSVDHIQTLKLGGAHAIRNIQLTCRHCNSSKGAKDPIEWASEKHGLLL